MIYTLDKTWERMKENSRNAEFLPTGFPRLDSFLDGGFLKKELVILGGFTGSGKSYLAGQWAKNIASKGFKSVYFSLEISNEVVMTRLVGQIADIKSTRILCNLLTEEEKEKVAIAKGKLAPVNPFLHLTDSFYKLQEIENIIKKGEYEFVIIDFIQNVMTNKKDEYSSMSYVSLELQRVAKEYNCCILVLSQISNSANKSEGVLEYKGSGGIAMVCDLGFFLVRDKEIPGRIYLQLRKNRRGMYGDRDLVMKGDGCLIEEYYGQ